MLTDKVAPPKCSALSSDLQALLILSSEAELLTFLLGSTQKPEHPHCIHKLEPEFKEENLKQEFSS